MDSAASDAVLAPLSLVLAAVPSLSGLELAGLAALAVFSYYLYWMLTFRPIGFPPGPTPVPFLGTFNGKHTSRVAATTAYAKQYGPVMSMSVNGVKPVVVVNDYETFKADIKGLAPSFANRPFNAFNASAGFDKGIVSTNGAHWLATRKFALMALRENGMGTRGLVKSIVDEADHLTARMSERAKSPWCPRELYQSHVANLVSSVIYGNRFEDNDPDLLNILEVLESQDANVETISTRLMMTHSFLTTWVPKALINRMPIMKMMNRLTTFGYKKIEESKANLDPNNPNSVVDFWLVEQRAEKPNPYLSDPAVLASSILDLLFAGIETTSMTMTWTSMYLAMHPELQERIYEEIVKKVGATAAPEFSDLSRLPLLNAFLHEVMRVSSIAPLGVEHCTTEPVTIGGFRVGKGTTVALHQMAIHHDPRLWKHDPAVFNPDNFLDDEGGFKCPPHFLAFGFGNRVCIGQNLAKTELLTFMTRILQRFRLSAPEELDFTCWGDFLRRPRDQNLQFTVRQ